MAHKAEERPGDSMAEAGASRRWIAGGASEAELLVDVTDSNASTSVIKRVSHPASSTHAKTMSKAEF